MNDVDTEKQLIAFASKIRTHQDKEYISLLEFTDSLGFTVILQLSPNASTAGRIDLLAQDPVITIYRKSKIVGKKSLKGNDEKLLTSRERFTIAHEIGHYYAYKYCGLLPEQGGDKKEYWKQEKIVNSFAGELLMPNWLSIRWIKGLKKEDYLNVVLLNYRRLGISLDVALSGVCRVDKYIGFMKVIKGAKKKDSATVLKVVWSYFGSATKMPGKGSHIDSIDVISAIEGSKLGSALLRNCNLGKNHNNDYNLFWQYYGQTSKGYVSTRYLVEEEEYPTYIVALWES